MAAKGIYNYVSTAIPDYPGLLNITPQTSIFEVMDRNQNTHYFDDGSNDTISFDDDLIVDLILGWPKGITESDAGTIFDFWNDVNKANGKARSFLLYHSGDAHIYVVKFKDKITREWLYSLSVSRYLGFPEITFIVEGVWGLDLSATEYVSAK